MGAYKTTVKPYLNTPTGRVSIFSGRNTPSLDDKLKYPIYYQVIYRRENTHIKSWHEHQDQAGYPQGMTQSDKMWPRHLDIDYFIRDEMRTIENLVRYESERDPKFSVIGIKPLYLKYYSHLFAVFNTRAMNLLIKRAYRQDPELLHVLCVKEQVSFIYFKDLMRRILGSDDYLSDEDRIILQSLIQLCLLFNPGLSDGSSLRHEGNLIYPRESPTFRPNLMDWLNKGIHGRIQEKMQLQAANHSFEIGFSTMVEHLDSLLLHENPF
jgi:hypothetical protein